MNFINLQLLQLILLNKCYKTREKCKILNKLLRIIKLKEEEEEEEEEEEICQH